KRVALDHVVFVTGNLHIARSPDLAIEISDIDDQGVPFPMSDGVAVIRRQALTGQRLSVRGDNAKCTEGLVQDHELVGSLHEFNRERHSDNAGYARHVAMDS